MSEETAADTLEYLAMYINYAASICALRDGTQQQRILWPWRGEDPKGQRHLQAQEASPARVLLCRRYAAQAVAALNTKTPL